MIEELLKYKLFIVAGWIGLFLLLENIHPYAISPYLGRDRWMRWLRNVSLLGLNTIMSPLIVLPITYWAVSNGLNWRESFMPEVWNSQSAILIDIICLDLFIYWWHRLNHQLPILWRFHEVHHLDEFLDVTSATRFHFGEVILSACVRGGFILIADIPLSSVIVFEIIIMICAIFQHSNVRLAPKFSNLLSYLVVTPDWHWQHHHAVREDTDSHYGTMFTIWDRLFSSRAKGLRSIKMKIGVEGRGEKNLIELLLRPIRRA